MPNHKFLILLFVTLSLSSLLNAQPPNPESNYKTKITTDSHGRKVKNNIDPPDEKLKMMSIRIEVEKPIGKKGSKFKIAPDTEVIIRVVGKSSDDRVIGLGYGYKWFRQIRPILVNENNIVLGFKSSAKEKYRSEWAEVVRRRSPDYMGRDGGPSGGFFGPRENLIGFVSLSEYYDKLKPGIYRIFLLLGFGEDENENKIQSKSITFEIVPKAASK